MMKRRLPTALTAVVLANVLVIAASIRWGLCPAERPHAWPGPIPTFLPLIMLGLVAILTFLAARHTPRRPLFSALLWPAIPLSIAWATLPARGIPTWPTLLILLVVGLAGLALHRRRGRPGPRPGLLDGIAWRWFHGTVLVAGIAAGILGGGFADGKAVALSLLLYPLYALVQLFLLLAVPWPWLKSLAGTRLWLAKISAGLLFALVHWPNPLLMILTGVGMLLWSHEYGRNRPLPILALSMGLLATVAAQGLPDSWTGHMRVGPSEVRLRAVPALAEAAHESTVGQPTGRPRFVAFMADLYPGIIEREATPEELERWWQTVRQARRGVLAWRFYISSEYQRRFSEPVGEEPLPGDVHWTDLPEPWLTRIEAFSSPTSSVPLDDWDGYLVQLYRDILQRSATPAARSQWSRNLSPRQEMRLVVVLLENRHELAHSPFDTLTSAQLRLHH